MPEIGASLTDLDTPTLWVDLDKLEANIASLVEHFRKAGVQWRPHTKGVKIPAIAHMLVRAGAIGVTCAKLGEAEVMVASGIRDILIANQVVGPHKYARLAGLCRWADVKIAVDSTATLHHLSEAAADKHVEIGVLVDVDTGMHRTGVQPGRAAVELAQIVADTPSLRFDGLMSWEGHALATDDPDAIRSAAERAIHQLIETVGQVRETGLPVQIVSCGGSGTYAVTPFISGVTEVQAGGAIFNDERYSAWGVRTDPAIFLRSVVTSRPAPDRIVFDAGYKTLPAWHGPPKPIGIDHVKKIAMSAEHGIVTLDQPNDSVQVGDVHDFLLGYSDATVFLHDELIGIRNGKVETVWKIEGRGRLQ